ncbi:MAG: hypothetical protein WKF97_08115 [Chitinophagaceae bacterium]
MIKNLVLLLATVMIVPAAFSQNSDNTKKPALAIYFLFNDFKTANSIRSNSLSSVLKDKQFAKLKEMSPGLAVSYLKGIAPNFDFSTTLAGSFLDYPFEGKVLSGNESLLLEADASIHAKMLDDKHWVVPYLSAGIGISKYKGYYGAILPLGAGIQVNFFDDAFLMLNSQYRLKVTDNSNYHFYFSIGIAGNLGSKEE